MGMPIQARHCPACSGGDSTSSSSTDTPTVADRMDSMSGMSMGGVDNSTGPDCKISMLWNWNTVDACFISDTWQIKSVGMFAGSCIGVILLVMALEALRRAVKEYDRYLIRTHLKAIAAGGGGASDAAGKAESALNGSVVSASTTADNNCGGSARTAAGLGSVPFVPPFSPKLHQQFIRALLHMVQFAVAYFIMLMAMYYNGYILFCIFLGAFLGSFCFSWETMMQGQSRTSAANEATVCCG